MKRILTLVLATLLALVGGPVGAQTYDGTSLAEGIFYTPANVGPGSDINFSVIDLEPISDLTFNLLDSDNNEVDEDVSVLGAVVVRTDAAGGFNSNIRLPTTLEAGVYTLTVAGTSADGSPYNNSLAITISDAAAANPTSSDAASLALTGSNTGTRVFGGLVLVLLGAALVGLASQRRRSEATVS